MLAPETASADRQTAALEMKWDVRHHLDSTRNLRRFWGVRGSTIEIYLVVVGGPHERR